MGHQLHEKLPFSVATVFPNKRIPSRNIIPQYVQPYVGLMRLEKPTGTFLIFWPFAFGLTMAAYRIRLSPASCGIELAKAFVCAALTHAFGCTVNDIADYRFDALVERTKTRPLASGRITYTGACICALAQLVNIVCISYLFLNKIAFIATLIQLLPLTCIYPFLKRVTSWPQAWLGLAFNFGIIISWLQISGTLDCTLLPVALAAFWAWTMLYDTVYACQDRADDIKVGVRSTALLFGSYVRPILALLGITFACALALAGYVNRQGPTFFVISVGGTVGHLLWQYVTVDLDDTHSCHVTFVRNGQLGWVIWGGLALDYVAALTGGI